MKILSAAEMKAVDRRAIEDLGIPGSLLMENAGLRVVEELRARWPCLAGVRAVVVAGKGNNGGDGLVVARHLNRLDAGVEVLLLGAEAELSGDAALNLALARTSGVPVVACRTAADWKKARRALSRAEIVVDAVFGTGLDKPAEGLFAAAIADINRAPGFVVAVDLPSGLSADAMRPIGPAVMADLTVALAAPKIAHVFAPASAFCGEIVVAGIGLPRGLLDHPGLKMEMIDGPGVAPAFAKRPVDTHKGSYGHLLVVAGSRGKTGAAILAGRAALRMGAGLVTVAVPASVLPVVARSMPELMTEPLPETPAGTIAAPAAAGMPALLKGKDALLLGPGLSTDAGTAAFVLDLLPRVKVPVVIDADGLNILASRLDVLAARRAPAVLTPHPGEFGRLLGIGTPEVLGRRLELAPAFAEKHGVFLVLKGYRTIIASPDGRLLVNPTGNPGMATGGAGDVLSGLIASEIMQSRDVLAGTAAAVFAHGFSGDLAAGKLGQKALTAGDLIRFLPAALRALEPE